MYNYFIKTINSILAKIGIESVEYICSSEAQADYLLTNEEKSVPNIILDIGYISSSVMCVCGRGLTHLKAFSLGGAHISADLSECLSISYNEAEQLKKQLILSVMPSATDDYEIIRKDRVIPISMQQTNEIVCARLDMICSLINKCLVGYRQQYPKMPYYITGGGISYIKGGKDYMSKMLGVNLTLLTPPDIHMQKPHFSSFYSPSSPVLSQQRPPTLYLM